MNEEIGNVVVSSNEKGNKLHKGKGTPEGGQFTSANDSSGVSSETEFNAQKRGHLINPAWEKLSWIFYDYDGDEDAEGYAQLLSEAEKAYEQAALPMIMEDTGYDEEQALIFQKNLMDYLGGDYEIYARGERPEETKIIDAGIKRMPKYDGYIFRGSHFMERDPKRQLTFNMWLNKLKPGAEITMRKTPTSWTSSGDVAWDNFGRSDLTMYDTIIFKCKNNKSGASVQHISKFGSEEAEVLVPSNTRYRVKSVDVSRKRSHDSDVERFAPPRTRIVLVELEEI